jgi:hypothetical protein
LFERSRDNFWAARFWKDKTEVCGHLFYRSGWCARWAAIDAKERIFVFWTHRGKI